MALDLDLMREMVSQVGNLATAMHDASKAIKEAGLVLDEVKVELETAIDNVRDEDDFTPPDDFEELPF